MPPSDEWLEPCLLIECEVRSPPDQCIIEIRGLILAENGKIITELKEIPIKSPLVRIDEVLVSGNEPYNDYVRDKKYHETKLIFTAPLSHYSIDYIETLRQRDEPKPRGVTFKVRFLIKYLNFNLKTAHIHKIDLNRLPPQLKTQLEQIKVGTHRPSSADSLIVYRYDPKYYPSSAPSPILATKGNAIPTILFLDVVEAEYSYRIPYEDWINIFLPKLKSYEIFTYEIPSTVITPDYVHLIRASKELKYTEEYLRKGEYENVIRSIRNIVMQHLTTRKEGERILRNEIKSLVLAHVPTGSKDAYEEVVKSIDGILRRLLQDHLSKFIKLDSEELIHTLSKSDAEYLFLTVISIVRYLNKLSLPSPK